MYVSTNWTQLLSDSSTAIYSDKNIFTHWADNMIDTTQAICIFRKNNDIEDNIIIPIALFEKWLQSLGYFR